MRDPFESADWARQAKLIDDNRPGFVTTDDHGRHWFINDDGSKTEVHPFIPSPAAKETE